MTEWMTCPVCGMRFDASLYQCLDNGNPACPSCVAKEQQDEERDEGGEYHE